MAVSRARRLSAASSEQVSGKNKIIARPDHVLFPCAVKFPGWLNFCICGDLWLLWQFNFLSFGDWITQPCVVHCSPACDCCCLLLFLLLLFLFRFRFLFLLGSRRYTTSADFLGPGRTLASQDGFRIEFCKGEPLPPSVLISDSSRP